MRGKAEQQRGQTIASRGKQSKSENSPLAPRTFHNGRTRVDQYGRTADTRMNTSSIRKADRNSWFQK